jgi:hypothetical protein
MSLCIDCPPTSKRPIKAKGRCATHLRAKIQKERERAADSRRAATFGITGSSYRELMEAQGGACACGRVPGDKAKRLAVDHDHKIAASCPHPPEQGCPRCIRGLLCYRCNTDILPAVGDDPERLRRLADYLENPPARQVFRRSH